MKSFGCMPAVRTPEASRTLTVSCPGILPSPLRDKVGAFHHDRFRGYVSVHFRSGLHPPCLRFAAPVAGRHARLGARLLARLCRGRHFRRLSSTRFQGATLTEPDLWISRPALRDAGSPSRALRRVFGAGGHSAHSYPTDSSIFRGTMIVGCRAFQSWSTAISPRSRKYAGGSARSTAGAWLSGHVDFRPL